MAAPATPPWQRKRPAGPRQPLTTEQKERARARAAAAGRRYPNLIDNMAIAREAKTAKPKPPR